MHAHLAWSIRINQNRLNGSKEIILPPAQNESRSRSPNLAQETIKVEPSTAAEDKPKVELNAAPTLGEALNGQLAPGAEALPFGHDLANLAANPFLSPHLFSQLASPFGMANLPGWPHGPHPPAAMLSPPGAPAQFASNPLLDYYNLSLWGSNALNGMHSQAPLALPPPPTPTSSSLSETNTHNHTTPSSNQLNKAHKRRHEEDNVHEHGFNHSSKSNSIYQNGELMRSNELSHHSTKKSSSPSKHSGGSCSSSSKHRSSVDAHEHSKKKHKREESPLASVPPASTPSASMFPTLPSYLDPHANPSRLPDLLASAPFMHPPAPRPPGHSNDMMRSLWPHFPPMPSTSSTPSFSVPPPPPPPLSSIPDPFKSLQDISQRPGMMSTAPDAIFSRYSLLNSSGGGASILDSLSKDQRKELDKNSKRGHGSSSSTSSPSLGGNNLSLVPSHQAPGAVLPPPPTFKPPPLGLLPSMPPPTSSAPNEPPGPGAFPYSMANFLNPLGQLNPLAALAPYPPPPIPQLPNFGGSPALLNGRLPADIFRPGSQPYFLPTTAPTSSLSSF